MSAWGRSWGAWYDSRMNTLAWRIETQGDERYTCAVALYDDTALLARTDKPGQVWQFRHQVGQVEAIAELVDITRNREERGSIIGEPVEFNLSLAAIAQIHEDDHFKAWVDAPTLYKELMAAVDPGMLLSWAPTSADWVTVGYVDENVTLSSDPPHFSVVGDIWIKP